MAILIFVLSLILLAGGVASGYQSLDLLPTGIGVLYALAAAAAVSGAVVTFAIAVAIRRIDALAKLIRQPVGPSPFLGPLEMTPPLEAPPPGEISAAADAIEVSTPGNVDEATAARDEGPININRTGHLPSFETIETVLETPQEPPSLIGSYSSAGANYKIFADGSIEAETSEGTFKFPSMSDFKRHLIETKGGRQTDEKSRDASTR